MTRDYTKVPGYEGMTQPQARYNCLHDLLDVYMRLTPEDRTAMAPSSVPCGDVDAVVGCPRRHFG